MIKRVSKNIGGKVKGKWSSYKNLVKNSFIGKSFREFSSTGKKVFNTEKTAGKSLMMKSNLGGKKVI